MEGNTKPLSVSELKKFGINDDFLNHSENLKELSKKTPNLVIAKPLRKFQFSQNRYKFQELRKRVNYVMSLGIYKKLKFDPKTGVKLLRPSDVTFKKLYKKYSGQNLNKKTLLVWRTGGIGDLLFIQPNLIHLKEKYPNCKIIFGCAPQYQPMINNWDCVDEIIDLPFGVEYLSRSDYHAIFDGVIERCKEATYTNSYRLFTKWLNLNLPDEKLKPTLTPKNELVDKCKKILNNWEIDLDNDNTVLLQMRASSPIRTPNPKVFSSLIDELTSRNYKVIITDSPHQNHNILSFIKQYVSSKEYVFNFSGYSESVDYTIALASLVDCCVSTDSSLIHISQGVGTPIFGIYGPFPGEVRMSTYNNADWINCDSMSCSPCFSHGHLPCRNSDKTGYSRCFNDMDVKSCCDRIENLHRS